MGAGVAGTCVLAWLAVLTVYDIRERRLPNWLTLPGAVVVLVAAAAAGRGGQALLGAAALIGRLSDRPPACAGGDGRR